MDLCADMRATSNAVGPSNDIRNRLTSTPPKAAVEQDANNLAAVAQIQPARCVRFG